MTWTNGEYAPKQRRAEEKKERLMDAALKRFSEDGYHGATAKAIAADAGVATGSFYRYFKDKKALFLAVCMRLEEGIMQGIFETGERLRREGAGPREVIETLVSFSIASHRPNRDFHREVLAMQMQDEDVAAYIRGGEDRVRQRLRDFLSAMRDALRVEDMEAAVELTHIVVEEVAHRSVLMESPLGAERMSGAAVDLLGRYLLRDGEGD